MEAKTKEDWLMLVGKGFFPEELPPSFTTADLGKLVYSGKIDFAKLSTVLKKTTRLLPYFVPRFKDSRRQLAIPNPIHFTQLSKLLLENWSELSGLIKRSKISVFDIDDVTGNNRFFGKPDYDKLTEKRIILSAGYRHLLIADVNRFYSSIYTHSIPWVIHSKAKSKEREFRFDNSQLGNAIDIVCRKMQDDQTVGIPIGPDTSRLIGELILSHVDAQLQKAIPNLTGIRNVDDYYLYFKTVADLEKARAILRQLLREYELELNPSKDNTIDLPEILENEWFSVIKGFRFRNDAKGQRMDLITFFDKCFYYSRKFPEDPVLTYGIAKLKNTIIKYENWSIVEASLLNAMKLESKVVAQVSYFLLSYGHEEDFEFGVKIVREAFEEFILFHLSLDHHFEVAWSLWFCSQMELRLTRAVTKELNTTDNPIIMLQVLHLAKKKLLSHPLKLDEWKKRLVPEELYTENWLFVYEALAGKWIKATSNFLEKDPFFKILNENDVRFFKPALEVDFTRKATAGPKGSLSEIMDKDKDDDDEEDKEADDDSFDDIFGEPDME